MIDEGRVLVPLLRINTSACLKFMVNLLKLVYNWQPTEHLCSFNVVLHYLYSQTVQVKKQVV